MFRPRTPTLLRCTSQSFSSPLPSLPLPARSIHTIPHDTVKLAYDYVPAPEPSSSSSSSREADEQSLVICHGLLGSKQNWRSLSKSFAQKLNMRVFVLDLRNHGTSPHQAPHDYDHMAADVARFFRDQGLEKGVNLMGHSMGGKAVMALALSKEFNSPLRSLINVDIAASKGKMSKEFREYVLGMQVVENENVKSKSIADTVLQKYEPDPSVRQFLLTNSYIHPTTKTLKFRVPLPILLESIPNIGDFPFPPNDASTPDQNVTWEGPVLSIKGSKSNYINHKNLPVTEGFFPRMRLEEMDTGHWVHSEKPREFVELVTEFIQGLDA